MSTSTPDPRAADASRQAVLAIRGADSARFLQGQLSADMEKLAPGASTLAGLHNVQGRVIALLGITRTTADEYLAVVPAELAAKVAQTLRKFVLRAKVQVEDVSATLQVRGMSEASPEVPSIAWGDRWLWLVPRGHARYDELTPDSVSGSWNRADVRQGLPQVYAATSESFVAQMLNLDLLGAIAFDKGCYTGQEVIARAHYRGRVKRRMQRWLNAGGMDLKPGDAARGPDGRTLAVIRTGPRDAQGQELLAVGTFGPGDAEAATSAATDTALVTVSGPLLLPYSLPE